MGIEHKLEELGRADVGSGRRFGSQKWSFLEGMQSELVYLVDRVCLTQSMGYEAKLLGDSANQQPLMQV